MQNNQEASALDNFDDDPELNEMLYARHAEITSLEDLTLQRGTTIPALFNTLYKFIQNPSSVSVETYKRMIDTDDTIGSGIDFLTICLAARLGEYTHPNKKIAKWVNAQLKYIKGGFYNLIKEILSATWAGFAVAEKVWENHPERGFVIKKCVTLPPRPFFLKPIARENSHPMGFFNFNATGTRWQWVLVSDISEGRLAAALVSK